MKKETAYTFNEKLIITLCWLLAIISVAVLAGEYGVYSRAKAYAENASKAVATAFTESSTRPSRERTSDVAEKTEKTDDIKEEKTYIINTNSKKIHSPSCPLAEKIKPENRDVITVSSIEDYIRNGYSYCSSCKGE